VIWCADRRIEFAEVTGRRVLMLSCRFFSAANEKNEELLIE